MNLEQPIKVLPQSFREEKKILFSKGINSWELIKSLTDKDINKLITKSLGSIRNLKRLRGIASLMCELDLNFNEAALLIHLGFPTIKSIASLSPEELFQRAGRFERLMRTGRKPVLDLQISNLLIKKARKQIIK